MTLGRRVRASGDQPQMDMRVRQPRHKRAAAAVDAAAAIWRRNRSAGRDARDTSFLDEHARVRAWIAAGSVDQRRVIEEQ